MNHLMFIFEQTVIIEAKENILMHWTICQKIQDFAAARLAWQSVWPSQQRKNARSMTGDGGRPGRNSEIIAAPDKIILGIKNRATRDQMGSTVDLYARRDSGNDLVFSGLLAFFNDNEPANVDKTTLNCNMRYVVIVMTITGHRHRLKGSPMMLKTNSLPPSVLQVIRDKATEQPFSFSEADESLNQPGSYLCRQCGLALFRAQAKFYSGCGWPSFDQSIEGAVKQTPDADGRRTEILCSRCDAHLGHVFYGEKFTAANTRYCVNTLSLDFVTDTHILDTEEAILAAGCFWGVEYLLKKLRGVLKTEVGYSGGTQEYPTYEAVCRGKTAHVEAVRVIYDPQAMSFEALIKFFFEIHDSTQTEGQGPDQGSQYLSVIFYNNEQQQNIADALKTELIRKGYAVATRILPVDIFWPAEKYHQDYYLKTGKLPYCHHYVRRF